jgi:hypothetical protein
MASDGETLYFSSDRPGGIGDNDIWKTRRLDKTWQKWSDPVNLGSPINTPEWDAFFTLDAGGEYAYMTTGLDTYGASDIVRIKLLEREKPVQNAGASIIHFLLKIKLISAALSNNPM